MTDDQSRKRGKFLVVRDNQTDLSFHGERMGFASSKPESPDGSDEPARWTDIALYLTDSGRFVVQRIGRSSWPNELDRHDALVCDHINEVCDYLGYGWLSKALYERAGIEPNEDLDHPKTSGREVSVAEGVLVESLHEENAATIEFRSDNGLDGSNFVSHQVSPRIIRSLPYQVLVAEIGMSSGIEAEDAAGSHHVWLEDKIDDLRVELAARARQTVLQAEQERLTYKPGDAVMTGVSSVRKHAPIL